MIFQTNYFAIYCFCVTAFHFATMNIKYYVVVIMNFSQARPEMIEGHLVDRGLTKITLAMAARFY